MNSRLIMILGLAFLAGDENVLFFLTKDDRLMRGNERFGFSLNRAAKKE